MEYLTRALAHFVWWMSYHAATPADRRAACRSVAPADDLVRVAPTGGQG